MSPPLPDPDANRTSADDGRTGAGADDPCATFIELASAALDGELAADEDAALARHLDECAPCQRRRARIERLVEALRSARGPRGEVLSLLEPALSAFAPRWREELAARLAAADPDEQASDDVAADDQVADDQAAADGAGRPGPAPSALEGCAPYRELISAQLDDELDEAEAEALIEHLARCSVCQLQRRRLRRAVERVRAAEPARVAVSEAALRELDRRLAAAAEDEAAPQLQAMAPRAARSPTPTAAPPPLRSAPDETPARSAAGRLLRLPRPATILRWSAAAAVLVAAAYLGVTRLPELRRIAAWDAPPSIDVQYQQATRPQPNGPAVGSGPDVAADGAGRSGSRVEPGVDVPSDRDLDPRADPLEVAHGADPEPGPESGAGRLPRPEVDRPGVDRPGQDGPEGAEPGVEVPEGESRPEANEPRAPQLPALTAVELARYIEQIRSADLPPDQRPHLIEGLGDPRCDHPLTLSFLGEVLSARGELDRLPDPNASRRAAFVALGRLGTPAAVRVLLSGTLRRAPHRDGDEAALHAALCALDAPAALAELGEALARLDAGRRAVALAALSAPLPAGTRPANADAAANPQGAVALAVSPRAAAGPGLLALLADRRASPLLRRDAALALGTTGAEGALDPLRGALEDRRPTLRQGAALGLGALSGTRPELAPACVAALAPALEDRDPRVRRAAALALGRTGQLAAAAPLVACLEEAAAADPALRRQVQRSLCALAGEAPARVVEAAEWRAYWARRRAAAPDAPDGSDGGDPGTTGAAPRPRAVDATVGVLGPTDFRGLAADAGGVVFLVDASGSMSRKYELALFELAEALDRCGSDTRFQLVSFGDGPRPLWPDRALVPATPQTRAEALAAARAQPVVDGVQTVLDRALLEALAYGDAEAIVLISDGLIEEARCAAVLQAVRRANRARPEPVRIHTLHLRDGGRSLRIVGPPRGAEPWDVRFMRQLAEEHGGVYVRN